jgi:hypothetical protein
MLTYRTSIQRNLDPQILTGLAVKPISGTKQNLLLSEQMDTSSPFEWLLSS